MYINYYFVSFILTLSTEIVQCKKQHLSTDIFTTSENDSILHRLSKYEIFTPKLIKKTKNKDSITYEIKTKSRSYTIQLHKNEVFLHADVSLSYFDTNNIEQELKYQGDNCYYHGVVKGLPHTSVTASTCNGLRGSIFFENEESLLFEPLEALGAHVLYKASSEMNTTEGTCMEFPNSKSTTFLRNNFIDTSMHTKLRRKRSTQKKFLELMVVVDHDLYTTRGKDLKSIYDRVKDLVNYMDSYYIKLGIRIVLLHVEVWTNENKIESDKNAINVLNSFLEYRKQQIQAKASKWVRTDNAQLLYGLEFEGSTVGMAPVSSMCGLRSGGVNMDHHSNVHHTAATMAHEMGHNFGMSHDTSDCDCSTDIGCVMSAKAGFTPPTAWSSCSKQYLEQGFKQGTEVCLLNIPRSEDVFGGPACGNGLVEKGEECDCGLPQDCQSKCCNASTCMLHETARCDEGACCTSNCDFKQAGNKCRGSINSCDLPEFCTGNSPTCPMNVYKMDGILCQSDKGTCYEGTCRDHDSQCSVIWGSGALNSDPYCYKRVNSLGDNNGNCGIDSNGQFRKCTEEHKMCGKLLCTGGESRPVVGRTRLAYRNRLGDLMCKTLSSPNENTTQADSEIGLVQDGTKCGDGKVCFDGFCKDISILGVTGCQDNCNGKGVCNNRNHCHCDSGWAPPDCMSEGNGGSVDSGPITTSTIGMEIVLILVLFLVVLPIALGIITYVWWKHCGGRPKYEGWKKRREAIERNKRGANTNNNGTKLEETTNAYIHPSPIVKKKVPPPSQPPPHRPIVHAQQRNAYQPGQQRPNIQSSPVRPPTQPPPPRPSAGPPPAKPQPVRPAPPVVQPSKTQVPSRPAPPPAIVKPKAQSSAPEPSRSAPPPPAPPAINKPTLQPSPIPMQRKPSPVLPPKPPAKPVTNNSSDGDNVTVSIKDRIKMMQDQNRI